MFSGMNRIEKIYYEAKHDKWFKGFAVFCRIALAASFIPAGFVKIIGERFAAGLPLVRLDPEQVRRVIINLVDNAIEAMERHGHIILETQHDGANNVARVVVADDGPGIPSAEREKLFLPYYSTKRRGSGLGLAIVRRIIAEHGGNIDVGDNTPRGTRFTIELPC